MQQVVAFLRNHWEWATAILATVIVTAFFGRAIYIRTVRNVSKQTASKGSVAAGGDITVSSETKQIAKDSSISSGNDVSSESVGGHSLIVAGSENVIVQLMLDGELQPDLLKDVIAYLGASASGANQTRALASTDTSDRDLSLEGQQAGKNDIGIDRVRGIAEKIRDDIGESELISPGQYASYYETAAKEGTRLLAKSQHTSHRERFSLAILWASLADLRSGVASAGDLPLLQAYANAINWAPVEGGLEAAGFLAGLSNDIADRVGSKGWFQDTIRLSRLQRNVDAFRIEEMALRRELEIRETTLGAYDPGLIDILNRLIAYYYCIGADVLATMMIERAVQIAEANRETDGINLDELAETYAQYTSANIGTFEHGSRRAVLWMARESLEHLLGEDHPRVADLWVEIADIEAFEEFTFDYAAEGYEKARTIYRKAYGDESAQYLDVTAKLCIAYREQGENERAAELEEGVAKHKRRKSFGY